MSIAIPQTLLTTLQATFDAEAKRLARDAAKILRVPEKEMLQVLKKVPKIQFKICDDNECATSCEIILQRQKLLERCRRPCVLGTGRCIKHQSAPKPPELGDHIQRLTLLEKHEEMAEALWCDESTRIVYNAEHKEIGALTDDDTLEIYEYLDESNEGSN
jgi:hypothetical protein